MPERAAERANAPRAAAADTKNDFEGRTSPEKRRSVHGKAGSGERPHAGLHGGTARSVRRALARLRERDGG